jgi:REP element-mobilizing transposase RayT
MGDALSPHGRKSTRIPGYDYTQPGTYYVTLVTHQRKCLFGTINGGVITLSRWAQIAKAEWERIPCAWPQVQLDAYVFMPNHIHGLIIIDPSIDTVGATRSEVDVHLQSSRVALATKPKRPSGPLPGSLGAIIGQFKSRVGLRINTMMGQKVDVWQRNYYEHIIRDTDEYLHARQYILDNPSHWETDSDYPGK